MNRLLSTLLDTVGTVGIARDLSLICNRVRLNSRLWSKRDSGFTDGQRRIILIISNVFYRYRLIVLEQPQVGCGIGC
jgi:alpha-D-ribose 1-methylphosphonate 5-triphosphate synthase subunit PhnL